MPAAEGRAFSDDAFTPILDPSTAPWHPSDLEAMALSKDVPLMTGTNEEEMTYFIAPDLLEPPADESVVVERIAGKFVHLTEAEVALLPRLIDAYPILTPDEDLLRIQSRIASDIWMARDSIAQAENRLKMGSAWAIHPAELPFIFGDWKPTTSGRIRASRHAPGDRPGRQAVRAAGWHGRSLD